MWWKWLPWKILVRKFARSRGFLDPLTVLSRVRRFSQPSEVMEPIELLRAGVAFHARGLMNSRAIQQNLDWVWPYWVEKQFNPRDRSFVPRAFSLTHINLTHRNWTALGIPDYEELPIVDPHGLVTPFYDGWSLDAWIYTDSGKLLAPSQMSDAEVKQELKFDQRLIVETELKNKKSLLNTKAEAVIWNDSPQCILSIAAQTEEPAWLVLALRPYNPEGISFINKLGLTEDRTGWLVEGQRKVDFQRAPDKHLASDYSRGDVALDLGHSSNEDHTSCHVGMATAAAMFRLDKGKNENQNLYTAGIQASMRLKGSDRKNEPRETIEASQNNTAAKWQRELAPASRLSIPNSKYQFLYEAAVRSIILHSPEEVYPGPYTYKRFWFRDAAFILNAMLSVGLKTRVRLVLNRFPHYQTPFGYFRSQEGEWDSNGQALWILEKYFSYTQEPVPKKILHSIEHGAEWLIRKRMPTGQNPLYGGLLPAGFSAEHLGANDYYYWDDFWAAAGFKSAAKIMQQYDKEKTARKFSEQAEDIMEAISRSLTHTETRLGRKAMPAAPARRLDAGAIGSIAPGYPLYLWSEDDPRLVDTLKFLYDSCLLDNGFFQDMIHSGINPYLTLHLAQSLMRAGDKRFSQLIKATADLASPTGQWPEAVHPFTTGGCMGDGQHIWAAAEWIMIIRNSLLYEETTNNSLVLGAGLDKNWLKSGQEVSFMQAPTVWGNVSLRFLGQSDNTVQCKWSAEWNDQPPRAITVRVPGCEPQQLEPQANGEITLHLTRKE